MSCGMSLLLDKMIEAPLWLMLSLHWVLLWLEIVGFLSRNRSFRESALIDTSSKPETDSILAQRTSVHFQWEKCLHVGVKNFLNFMFPRIFIIFWSYNFKKVASVYGSAHNFLASLCTLTKSFHKIFLHRKSLFMLHFDWSSMIT